MVDAFVDIAQATGNRINTVGDFTCGRTLLFYGISDGADQFAYLVNNRRDALDLAYGHLGGGLHVADLIFDMLGRPGRLIRQFFDPHWRQRKAFARFTCTGSFNGGIECQKVGLF